MNQPLHDAICLADSFVITLGHCVNFKVIRYERTSLNRIVGDKSHSLREKTEPVCRLAIPFSRFNKLYCFYFRYYWVVVLELEIGADGKPKSPSKAPSDYNRTEIKTYEEYLIERRKGSIVPYIAGYFTTFPQNGLFIIGNDTTFKVKKRKRRNTRTTSYRNGPLIAATSYVVFQRAFVTDVSLFISLS